MQDSSFGLSDGAIVVGDAESPSDPYIQPEEAVQKLFTRHIKRTINSQVQHFGHGSRTRKLTGKLKVTSPWFRPDEIFPTVPNRQQILAGRVYMCVPEYLCPAIGLPDCPHCEKNDQVLE